MNICVYGENVNEEFEIDIDEFNDIEDIKFQIEDKIDPNIICFQMIYGNIVFNENMKQFNFSKFGLNSKIWIGNLENFLKEQDVILELFIVGDTSSVVNIIVSKNDKLDDVKSIIHCVIEGFSIIYNIHGSEINCKKLVNDIEYKSEYKLIINTSKKCNFKDCIVALNRNLIISYLANNDLTYMWYRNDFNECRIDALKTILHDARESLNYKEENQECLNKKNILNENLGLLPMAFINSQYLFCEIMTDRICENCNDCYWKNTVKIGKYDEIVASVFRQYFRDATRMEILDYIKDRQQKQILQEISMKDLAIKALVHCNDYLDYPSNDWRSLMKKFLYEFSFEPHINDSEIEEVINKWNEDHSTVVIKWCG